MYLGVDTHKQTHTMVALDEHGQHLGTRTVPNTPEGWATALTWAREQQQMRCWGVENSGSLGKGFAQFLLGQGEAAVREVSPQRTAQYRRGRLATSSGVSRSFGDLGGMAPKSGARASKNRLHRPVETLRRQFSLASSLSWTLDHQMIGRAIIGDADVYLRWQQNRQIREQLSPCHALSRSSETLSSCHTDYTPVSHIMAHPHFR